MPGPLPKQEATRIRRNGPTFDGVLLPAAGRAEPAPPLPAFRQWSQTTRDAWAEWWATPQAVAWDQSGKSLHRWALLFDRLVTDPDAPVALHAQIQAIEDRHGFSPAFMAKLRWRIDAEAAERPHAAALSGKAAKERRLKAV